MDRLRLDIWSDIACPWCFIGKRHIERALADFPHAAFVDVVWRAYELDPSAPKENLDTRSYAERIAAKYNTSPAQGQVMIDRVIDAGVRAGIGFRYDIIKPGNTFDAHRVVHWALEQGKQSEMQERVTRAYMEEGQEIGEPEVLATLAGEIGLDPADARAMLATDRFAAEVREDEALARELGITGVPFFVLGGRLGVSGAQPVETLRATLDKAWAERS